ncbi:MAG: hypothetical protein FWF28_05645 [Micrococcales bacterium]|nr:hypothetical protein [Micrococcales bacterium]
MERQRCVINAVAQQAQPSTLLLRYEKVASAAKQTIITDIPQSALPALVTLAERVQGTTMRSIVFQNGKDGFATANPNWPKVRSQVQTALKETAKTNKTPVATPTPGTTASPSSKPTSSPKGSTKAPSSVSLDDACAYNPHPYNSGSGG